MKFGQLNKGFVENHLNCKVDQGGYYFNRYEFQHRGGIHVHGIARIANGSKIQELAAKCILGHG